MLAKKTVQRVFWLYDTVGVVLRIVAIVLLILECIFAFVRDYYKVGFGITAATFVCLFVGYVFFYYTFVELWFVDIILIILRRPYHYSDNLSFDSNVLILVAIISVSLLIYCLVEGGVRFKDFVVAFGAIVLTGVVIYPFMSEMYIFSFSDLQSEKAIISSKEEDGSCYCDVKTDTGKEYYVEVRADHWDQYESGDEVYLHSLKTKLNVEAFFITANEEDVVAKGTREESLWRKLINLMDIRQYFHKIRERVRL